MFLLVAHFRLEPSDPGPIPEIAREPLALLAAAPECRRLHFARSTDAADHFVLVAEFDSAASYRRSLSPWPMRIQVIPWLSGAELDVTAVNEVLYSSIDGAVVVSEPTVPDPGR
jgi:hypothetical protein